MHLSGPRYLKLFLSLTALLVLAVGAINFVVDPCGIYHAGKAWDWTRSRPEILEVAFINKAYGVETAQADILLLGNSRVAQGLDPHSAALPAHAYNLGIPGSGMVEQWRYLQHAGAAHMPTTVVLGIDIENFGADRKNKPMFSDDRLLVQADGRPTSFLSRFFADIGPTLFSFSTLQFSYKTLRASKALDLKFPDGYEENAPRIFEQMDLASRVLAANKAWVDGTEIADYRLKNGRAPQMEAFAKIVAYCQQHNIRLLVFVQPLHAALLDKLTDNWPRYADWMRTIAAQTTTAELWDFSSYSSISTEPFPLPTDKMNGMHFYWEGSHYRKIVGDLVLQRLFAGTGPADFGLRVTSANVEQDLSRLQAEKQAWHEQGLAVPIDMGPAATAGTTPPAPK